MGLIWFAVLLLLTNVNGDLEVIGAGMGRTGTTSLKVALERLGFGVCHHMQEVLRSFKTGFSHAEDWAKLKETEPMSKERKELIKHMFPSDSHFHSITDYPGAFYYRELAELYPNAKIILTVRDNADAWIKSVDYTIGHFFQARSPWGVWPDPGIYLLFRLNPVFWKFSNVLGSFNDHDLLQDHESKRKYYLSWKENVTQYFKGQQEKLLVFNVKEGWDPLCKFLNVPVPEIPFPRVNESGHMLVLRISMNFVGFLHFLVLLLLLRYAFRRVFGNQSKNKQL